MGRYTPRTSADELRDARAALDSAFVEMRNWRGHLESMAAHPNDREALGHQATRSAKIVAALIAEAEQHSREADRLDGVQPSVVS
jgi:hypothetical protein